MAQPLPNTLPDDIRHRLISSPLHRQPADAVNLVAQGVFIANPWSGPGGINVTGIGRPTGPGSSAVVQHMSPDGNTLKATLNEQELKALGWSEHRPTHEEAVRAYLEWGMARAKKRPFYGVCDSFTCVTIAMLAARQSPLPADMPVEWFGQIPPGGVSGRGHAITVVNRDPATDATDPTSWGNDCLIVDSWYALQADADPVQFVNGPNRDATFMGFIYPNGASIRLIGSFRARTYPWLGVAPI